MKYEVIYNSGLTIRDSVELATFCCFYDRTYLPYTDQDSCRHLVTFVDGKARQAQLRLKYYDHKDRKLNSGDEVIEWKKKHSILFYEKVLTYLPPDPVDKYAKVAEWLHGSRLKEIPAFKNVNFQILYEILDGDDYKKSIAIHQDVVAHLLRRDLTLPGVFMCQKGRPHIELLKALGAKAVFAYLLPALSNLHDEQIMEVRRKVKDTREGFSMHLQKLSRGVQDRLDGGDTFEDITAYSREVIETNLIPDFVEFRRQLVAERAGFWAKVLDKAGKVFEIDAAPWTPKFYSELMNALGFSILTYASNKKDSLSNRIQALQFMSSVSESNLRFQENTKG